MPFAPSSVLVPSSKARSPVRSVLTLLVALCDAEDSAMSSDEDHPSGLRRSFYVETNRWWIGWRTHENSHILGGFLKQVNLTGGSSCLHRTLFNPFFHKVSTWAKTGKSTAASHLG